MQLHCDGTQDKCVGMPLTVLLLLLSSVSGVAVAAAALVQWQPAMAHKAPARTGS